MAKKSEPKMLRTMFRLEKVKVLKNMGGLDVKYVIQHRNKDVVNEKSFQQKNPMVPHPDLMQSIEKLDIYLAKVYGLNRMDAIRGSAELSNKEAAAFKDLKKIIDAANKEQLDRTSVTGIAISGEDKNLGVIITGTYACDNNIDSAINSPRIKLVGETFKFEADLAELVDKIVEETFCYLFENKRADPELFGDDDED